jgi:hypothetical protein
MVNSMVNKKTTYLDKRCKWLIVSVGVTGLLALLVRVVRTSDPPARRDGML